MPTTLRHLAVLLVLLATAACGGNDGTSPDPDMGGITVSGVEDGATYQAAVTLIIEADAGWSYTARLNGEPVFSGTTVSQQGSYTLSVEGWSGSRTRQITITFQIVVPGSSTLIVRVLDLGANASGGGGDAILVTDSSGAGLFHALVDAGPAGSDASDPGYVARRLAALGVDTLQALVLTHAHGDHFEGMPAVLSGPVVRTFVYNGQQRSYSAYNAVVSQARSAASEVVVPDTVLHIRLGGSSGADLAVLSPLSTYLQVDGSSSEINDGSLGAGLSKGTFRMFLAGDGEILANQRWMSQFARFAQDVDALKVGHHGANDALFDNGYSGTSSWLSFTSPALAFISANGTTHPREHALNALLARSSLRTYCTNVHGEITLRVTSGGSYTVSVERNPTADCVPGSEATT